MECKFFSKVIKNTASFRIGKEGKKRRNKREKRRNKRKWEKEGKEIAGRKGEIFWTDGVSVFRWKADRDIYLTIRVCVSWNLLTLF